MWPTNCVPLNIFVCRSLFVKYVYKQDIKVIFRFEIEFIYAARILIRVIRIYVIVIFIYLFFVCVHNMQLNTKRKLHHSNTESITLSII